MPLRLSHRYILEGSKNPVLREICFLVDRYNLEFSSAPAWAAKKSLDAQAAALAGLAYRAGAYMTSKPPQTGKFKNKTRWDAMRDLMAELMREAQRIGVKLVRGPADFRTITGQINRQTDPKEAPKMDDSNVGIWLEVLDPQHRHAYDLSGAYQKWLKTAGKVSFWDYVGTNTQTEVDYYQGLMFATRFEGQLLVKEDGERVHTEGFRSLAAGDGWCIFVLSPDGTLFVHEHERSKFHHTSFLGGGAVLAAGEIAVDQGRVAGLTAKTGHYWTTPELMQRMVQRLREIPDSAIIRPDVLEKDGVRFYRVKDYRANGAKATPLDRRQIVESLPSWARGLGSWLRRAPAPPAEPERMQETLVETREDKKKQGYFNPV